MDSHAQKHMNAADWATLGYLGLIWGASFFFGKVASPEVAPFSIVMARVAIALPVLLLILRLRGLTLPSGARHWFDATMMGLLNSLIPFSLIFWAMTHIGSGLSSILNATTPLFAVVLVHFAFGEKMTANRTLGVLAGILGVGIMVGHDALSGLAENVLAELAVVGAALCYALASIYARRMRHVPPLVVATGQVLTTLVMITPIALLVDRPWERPLPGPASIASLLALGLLSTALAYIAYFALLVRAGAMNVTLVTFIIPVSGTLLGWLVLHEELALRHIAGMALIALGLAAIDGRAIALLRRKKGD